MKLVDRFWSKVNKKGPWHPALKSRCWVWLAGKSSTGYGRFRLHNIPQKGHPHIETAHRVAFFLEYGHLPFPEGLHRCDNPICVRPSHIFEGTQADNIRDKKEKGREPLGSKRPNSKFTENQIKELITLKKKGWTLFELADKYKVCFQVISDVVRRKTWRHVCV
jgi:hypothetical protein